MGHCTIPIYTVTSTAHSHTYVYADIYTWLEASERASERKHTRTRQLPRSFAYGEHTHIRYVRACSLRMHIQFSNTDPPTDSMSVVRAMRLLFVASTTLCRFVLSFVDAQLLLSPAEARAHAHAAHKHEILAQQNGLEQNKID